MDDATLLEAATEARERAYAPYSRFRVGAAVLDGQGRIHTGANVENASYGLTMCAERVAIGRARMRGMERIQAIAVVTGGDDIATPCGACRQVIREFGPEARIISALEDGEHRTDFLGDLLPDAFGPEDLLTSEPDDPNSKPRKKR